MSGPSPTGPGLFDFVSLLVNGAVTVGAAFAGAWIAFRLERTRKADDVAAERVAGGNRALFGLLTMWEILKQYEQETVANVRGAEDLWLNLDAAPPLSEWQTLFDGRDVSFLLDTTSADIFHKLMLEERRFRLIMSLLKQHADLVLGEMHDRLSEAGIQIGERRDVSDFERILGVKIVHHLRQLTRHIVEFVDEDVASMPGTFRSLRTALVAFYPDRKFINTTFQIAPIASPAAEPTADQDRARGR